MRRSSCCLVGLVLILTSSASAGQPLNLVNVPVPPPLVADEPLAREFSLKRAAQSLDTSALYWQKTRKCAACHTLPPYLMARPYLASVSPEPPEVRRFFETIVAQRLEEEPALPKDAAAAVVVEVAAALAFHDRATTGKLHPSTRQELERMWTLQRPDGSWQWPFRDTPPIKSDEHFGVTMAALAAGLAPENYSQSEGARNGLARIRQFLKALPPTTLHQKAMLLWAGICVEDLLSPKDKEKFLGELRAAQRPDGGWSLASLGDNHADSERQTEAGRKARMEKGYGHEFLVFVGREAVYKSLLTSDGYATGLVVYVLRQAGVPTSDPQVRGGLDWLKRNQRASGRWFTGSQSWHTQNFIANAGTAFAVLALYACGEIPGPSP